MDETPLRERVSGIDTIWDLTDGRIPEKGERFIVLEEEWDSPAGSEVELWAGHPVRTIRRVEIL